MDDAILEAPFRLTDEAFEIHTDTSTANFIEN
jgi:hypothetical protein